MKSLSLLLRFIRNIIDNYMNIDSILNEFTETRDCFYKGEHYSVRDNGAVFRRTKNPQKNRKYDERWSFGTKKNKTGYMFIGDHRVHIIVATAFLGSHDSKKDVVDHIDTNRCNNRVENLRWMTRLENALNNPVTRKRIEFLCGGDIQKFIDDPSCIRDPSGTNKDLMWMRTVTKEEAQASYQRVMEWSQKPSSTSSNGSMGEWIYAPIKQPNFIDAAKENDPLRESLTSNALQRNWSTPTEFPLCPSEWNDDPLLSYMNNLRIGAVITKNQHAIHTVDEFTLYKENKLLVRTHTGEGQKRFSLLTISFEEDKFVHEGSTYFEERGSVKAFTLAQGMEWIGGDGIDDYC